MSQPWLKGWKAIAAYLQITVKTAKTYHKKYRMPVHKLPGSMNAAVMAAKSQLDDWIITYSNLRNDLIAKKRKKG